VRSHRHRTPPRGPSFLQDTEARINYMSLDSLHRMEKEPDAGIRPLEPRGDEAGEEPSRSGPENQCSIGAENSRRLRDRQPRVEQVAEYAKADDRGAPPGAEGDRLAVPATGRAVGILTVRRTISGERSSAMHLKPGRWRARIDRASPCRTRCRRGSPPGAGKPRPAGSCAGSLTPPGAGPRGRKGRSSAGPIAASRNAAGSRPPIAIPSCTPQAHSLFYPYTRKEVVRL